MIPALSLALMAIAVGAQTPAPAATVTVTGTVIHARTLAPIADVHVTIVELGRETATDTEGRFTFTGVPAGKHTLAISTIGYIFVRRPIVVADEPLSITIPLAEGAGTYQESVTVTATAADNAAPAVRTVSEALLQGLRGVMADDPVRALQTLPGVAASDDFRAEFSVRGAAFRQIGTVIDGTPTAQLFHTLGGVNDAGTVSMINTDVLSGASLTAGPHTRKDGDWIGATVTFDIREGSRDRTAARLAVSGTSTSVVVEGPIGGAKRGSWLGSLRKSYIGWLVKKVRPDIGSTFGFTDTQAKGVYDLTSRQQVQLVLVGGIARYLKLGSSSPNDTRRSLSESVLGSVAWRYARARAVFGQRLSFVSSRIRNQGSQLQEQAFNRGSTLQWRGDATVGLTSAWTLDAGLQAAHQQVSQVLRDFAAASGGGVRVRNEQAIDGRRLVSSGWAQLAHDLPAGRVAMGARLSGDTRTGDVMASPWLTMEHRIDKIMIFGGAGQSAQFPALEEMAQSSTPLLTEHSWQTDLGMGGPLAAGLRGKVTAFHREDRDGLRRASEARLVDGKLVVASTFPDFASTIRATTNGVDFVLELHATHGPTGWLGYTWAHTRAEDRASGEQFDGDFDQRHTINMFLEQRMSYRMKATAKFRYGSNFPIQGYYAGVPEALTVSPVRNSVRLPAYARLDLSGSRTFEFSRARLTLFIELVNVTDHHNYAAGDGVIRSNLTATDFVEELIPFVPSAGILIEF